MAFVLVNSVDGFESYKKSANDNDIVFLSHNGTIYTHGKFYGLSNDDLAALKSGIETLQEEKEDRLEFSSDFNRDGNSISILPSLSLSFEENILKLSVLGEEKKVFIECIPLADKEPESYYLCGITESGDKLIKSKIEIKNGYLNIEGNNVIRKALIDEMELANSMYIGTISDTGSMRLVIGSNIVLQEISSYFKLGYYSDADGFIAYNNFRFPDDSSIYQSYPMMIGVTKPIYYINTFINGKRYIGVSLYEASYLGRAFIKVEPFCFSPCGSTSASAVLTYAESSRVGYSGRYFQSVDRDLSLIASGWDLLNINQLSMLLIASQLMIGVKAMDSVLCRYLGPAPITANEMSLASYSFNSGCYVDNGYHSFHYHTLNNPTVASTYGFISNSSQAIREGYYYQLCRLIYNNRQQNLIGEEGIYFNTSGSPEALIMQFAPHDTFGIEFISKNNIPNDYLFNFMWYSNNAIPAKVAISSVLGLQVNDGFSIVVSGTSPLKNFTGNTKDGFGLLDYLTGGNNPEVAIDGNGYGSIQAKTNYVMFGRSFPTNSNSFFYFRNLDLSPNSYPKFVHVRSI